MERFKSCLQTVCHFLSLKNSRQFSSFFSYASLYFCCAIEQDDNELLTLETIHRYVELLDKYFGSVCELDIIFNFEKAYFIFDEFVLGGEIQETSKKSVLKAVNDQDVIQEVRRRFYSFEKVPRRKSKRKFS